MEIRRQPKGSKLYRGAYQLYKNQTMYAEEEFEVYKNMQDLSFSFFSLQYARIPTGELLTTYVDYEINKKFIPQRVLIEKSLGKDFSTEIFSYNESEGMIDYHFFTDEEQTEVKINTHPKFSISTSAVATSMLFLRSKKEDTIGKNHYSVLSSNNKWKFEEAPQFQIVTTERKGTSGETIAVNGKSLNMTRYLVTATSNYESDVASAKPVDVAVSKFATIPYQLLTGDDIKIQIKYLNNLDRDS